MNIGVAEMMDYQGNDEGTAVRLADFPVTVLITNNAGRGSSTTWPRLQLAARCDWSRTGQVPSRPAVCSLPSHTPTPPFRVVCARRPDNTDARHGLAAQGTEREHPLRWPTSDSQGRQ